MRIEDHRSRNTDDEGVLAFNIPVGTFFTGAISNGRYKGLFVRTATGVVSLNNPKDTWTGGSFGPAVVGYQAVNGFIRIERNA